ncbi:MAG: hypothetical protein H0X24_19210 [Ktedonobacterales bacterium]|nr:hypothetical protein [Ktedonobacterales bacterium]
MGIFDTLFGRQKPVPPAKNERLFAISTADVTLQTQEDMRPAQTAGLCFQGIASAPFKQINQELEELLKIASNDGEAPVTAKSYEDKLGYKWVLIASEDFQQIVTTVHVVSQKLIDEGYGDVLLAAVFRFNDEKGKPVYFIYNYKRGNFYPFVPRPDSHSHQRNNGDEMRLGTVMKRDLPMEPELERWFAMWDLPF